VFLFCALSIFNARCSPTEDHFRKSDVLSVLNGFQCLCASVQPCSRIMRESILLYNDVSAEQGRTVTVLQQWQTGVALLCNGACLAFSLRLSLLSSAYQLNNLWNTQTLFRNQSKKGEYIPINMSQHRLKMQWLVLNKMAVHYTTRIRFHEIHTTILKFDSYCPEIPRHYSVARKKNKVNIFRSICHNTAWKCSDLF